MQMVQQIGERFGKGFGSSAGGGRRLSMRKPGGDDKLVPLIQEELLMSEWRVAIGMSAIKHQHCRPLTFI